MQNLFVILNLKNSMYLKFNEQGEVEYTKKINSAHPFFTRIDAFNCIDRELNGIFQVIEIYIK